MITTFKAFIEHIIVENLAPTLQRIIQNPKPARAKQDALAQEIRRLGSIGERTGIEGNMPKGSSRAYLQHATPENVTVDGRDTKMKVGTKVAIRAALDKYHRGDRSLGEMQNETENGDHFINQSYRILTKNPHTGDYTTNHERGILPPLISHDEENHQSSTVGHVRDIKDPEFKKLTRTQTFFSNDTDFPKGISHKDFSEALNRRYDRNNGRYWEKSPEREAQLDKIDEHPLVQKFHDYHDMTGHPTHDLAQIKNLGVFEHPVTGEAHIVARDHGYGTDVMHAYSQARRNNNQGYR